MGTFFNWRTLLRAAFMGIGAMLLTQPSPFLELGVALQAIAVAIGSGTGGIK
jgi:hypothetical protein